MALCCHSKKIKTKIRGLLVTSWASTEINHVVNSQKVTGAADLLLIIVTEGRLGK